MNLTQLLDDAMFIFVNKTVMIPVNMVITILGILNNIVTIVVFIRLASTDTMTISLTALAVSDLLFFCLTLPNFIISALVSSGIQVLWSVDLKSLQYIGFVWQRPLFHKISITITMFVSCERSLCVVKPFLVKRIFTRRRVITVLVGIYFSLTALFMPVYVSGGLVKEETINGTHSILTMNLAPERALAEQIVHLGSGFSLVVTSQIIIVISTFVMAIGLRRHQRFRKGASSTGQRLQKKQTEHDLQALSNTDNYRNRVEPFVIRTNDNTGVPDETSDSKAKVKEWGVAKNPSITNSYQRTEDMSPQLKDCDKKDVRKKEVQTSKPITTDSSAKEHRLIKTVFTLAVMHVVLNSPVLIHYIYYYIEPEFRVNLRLANLYFLSTDIGSSLYSLNGMLNLYIYLVLNTKFRSLFLKIFCCNLT